MNESAPKGGADTDNLWPGKVCISFSYAIAIEFAGPTTGWARSQSERDLDLLEAAVRRAESRASGNRERSERNDGERSRSWRVVV